MYNTPLEVLKSEIMEDISSSTHYSFCEVEDVKFEAYPELPEVAYTMNRRDHEVFLIAKVVYLDRSFILYNEERSKLEEQGYIREEINPYLNKVMFRKVRRVTFHDHELYDLFMGYKDFFVNFETKPFDKQLVLSARALESDLRVYQEKYKKEAVKRIKLEERIRDFDNLPWFKRVWKILRGERL